MAKLTVIIPSCNEKPGGMLQSLIQFYGETPSESDYRFVLVDDGSGVEVLESAREKGWFVVSMAETNRAQRINRGLEKSDTELICLHHPRSVLPLEAFSEIIKTAGNWTWGGFTHGFDHSSLGLRWTSWYSNKMRSRFGRILYLDHCIFFHQKYLSEKIPEIPIFEDTEISKILRKHGAPKILPLVSKTSAIRFQTNGFWKQSLMNQFFKLGYWCGVSKDKMDAFYEKRLNLNSRK